MTNASRGMSIAWTLALACCLGGESDLPLGSHCTSDEACVDALLCQYGRCRSPCNVDIDCPDDGVCVASEGTTGERVCTTVHEADCTAAGCPDGLECGPDKLCREECTINDDCMDGWMCVLNFCMATTGAGVEPNEGVGFEAVDLDGDGCVEMPDLATLLGAYGSPSDVCPDCDIDGNGEIDGEDLRSLLAYYGDGC